MCASCGGTCGGVFSEQFDGLAHPKPRGGYRGVPRQPTAVSEHPDHGKVGTLSAIARELGVSVAALNMQKKRRPDFPTPVAGHTYALEDIQQFRGGPPRSTP